MTTDHRPRIAAHLRAAEYRQRLARRIFVLFALAGLLCFIGLCASGCSAPSGTCDVPQLTDDGAPTVLPQQHPNP